MEHISGSLRRFSALALAALLAAGCGIPVSAAEPVGNGVTPTCDEAYYATLDYYGNLAESSIVKSYALNGADQITDYGIYDEVVNLTDGTAPQLTKEGTSFQFDKDAAPSHFYFEAKTDRPYEALPWTITLHYTLNGVPTPAEELPGKTGVVEICVDLIPNESASQYARYNYTLEAMALFNQDDILSLEAPGAQVQLIGNLRMVLFLALPGEEQHFTVRVGAEDFAFEGFTFLMTPATLSQLEKIADLSQRREELEDDYHKLSGGFDDLLNSMGSMTGSLNAAASGLDQLNDARGTFSDGKDVLYDGTDTLREDLTNLAEILEPVSDQIQALSETITTSKDALNTMMDTVVSLKGQLKDMETALENLEDGSGDIKDLVQSAADLRGSLSDLRKALDSVSGGGSSQPSELPSSQAMVRKVKAVHAAYDETDRTAFFSKMLILNGTTADKNAADAMAQGLNTLADIPAVLVPPEQQANWQTAQKLKALYERKGSMSFQKFCEQLPNVTPEMAKQMNDIWIVSTSGSLSEEELAATLNLNAPEPGSEPESGGGSDIAPQPEPQPEAPPENDSVGGAAVDLITDGLDQASSKIAQLQREMNHTIDTIARPTSRLIRDLEGLCRQLDDLVDLLDDAENLTAALRSASGKMQELIDTADTLRGTLNDYEPTLQTSLQTLQSMAGSLALTARHTESLIGSAEDLLRRSGTQLDAGTQKTLSEMATVLRRTANVMAASSSIKSSKDALTGIIEDTWNEHTGELDNLLNMDATAETQSLTDPRNPAPQSVQVLIRSQEIQADEEDADSASQEKPDKGTLWSRIAQMFKDFWAAITGLFH